MNERRTRILKADAATIKAAAALLCDGGLVAFPTETVYGLGADAANAKAVASLYGAKGRPAINPLIAHVTSLEAALPEGLFNADALLLAEAFWPGPLTLVVPASAQCSVGPLARAGLDSVGLRCPSHPVAQAILAAVGRPVVAPSANRSGHVSPTEARHVADDLMGRIDLIVDGGATHIGVESTIIACLERPRLLRAGQITRAQVEAVLGQTLETASSSLLLAPGMMASHYAPKARLRLNATHVEAHEALMAFGPLHAVPSGPVYQLSETASLDEAASRLFAALRALDDAGALAIAVAPIPDEGIGEAINDRLSRAAAPKE